MRNSDNEDDDDSHYEENLITNQPIPNQDLFIKSILEQQNSLRKYQSNT